MNAHEEADRLWGECEPPEDADHECQALRGRVLELEQAIADAVRMAGYGYPVQQVIQRLTLTRASD